MTWIISGSPLLPVETADRLLEMLESGKGLICIPSGVTLTQIPNPLPWWPIYAPHEQAEAAWWAANLNMEPVE